MGDWATVRGRPTSAQCAVIGRICGRLKPGLGSRLRPARWYSPGQDPYRLEPAGC